MLAIWWVLLSACTQGGCTPITPLGPMTSLECIHTREGIMTPIRVPGAALLPSFWIEARCERVMGPDLETVPPAAAP